MLIRQPAPLNGVFPNDNRKIGKDASVLRKTVNTFLFGPNRLCACANRHVSGRQPAVPMGGCPASADTVKDAKEATTLLRSEGITMRRTTP